MHFHSAKAGFTLAAWLCVIPCAFAVCSGPQTLEAKLRAHPDGETYTQLGNWFGDHNQYDCAVEAFRAGLKLEPGSAKLDYLLGLSLFSSGNAKDAVAPLQQSIQLMPEVIKPHLVLAAVFEQLQQKEEAGKEYEAALNIDPNSTLALAGMSNLLLTVQNYGAVVELLHSANLNEGLALNLALAYGKLGRIDDASNTLTRTLHAHPASLALTKALVAILVQQTHYQEAVKLAKECVVAHPHDLDAQRLYLRILVLNDNLDLARPLGQKLLSQSPHDFDFLYLNGILERQAGKYTAARDHLEAAVALDPSYYNAHYNLGAVLAQLKDYPGARDHLEKAIALGATEPEVRFELATVLRNLGETEQAQEQLKLYQKESQEKANRTVAAQKAAQAEKQLAAGDVQSAIASYREALNATPQDPVLNFKLALALDRGGDVVGEKAALEQALKIDPAMAIAQNQAGYLASRDGDFATAEQHFRSAVSAAPGYAEAWVNLAATLGMESHFPEAREAVANALKIDPQNTEALQLQQNLNSATKQN
jgi:tetratricopeptide (TPR) repeat protein